MDRLFFGLSTIRAIGSPSLPNLICPALLIINILCSGCTPPSTTRSSKIEELEQKNQTLTAQVESLSQDQLNAFKLLNEITDHLASLTGREFEVRAMQGELDPATWNASTDLRKEIFDNLDDLEDKLSQLETKNRELSRLVRDKPQYAELSGTISNLQELLREKEATISYLRNEMEELENHAQNLQQEVDERRSEAEYLRDQVESGTALYDEQQQILDQCRKELTEGYYLAGSPDQIRAAERQGNIRKSWKTYHVPDIAITSSNTPRGFRTINPEFTEIPLGSNLRRVKILSVHKRYESLFYVGQSGQEWYLRLKDPFAFWRVSRYVIIEIQY